MLKKLSLAVAAAALLGTMAAGPSYANHDGSPRVQICHHNANGDGYGEIIEVIGCGSGLGRASCRAHLANHHPDPHDKSDYECQSNIHWDTGGVCIVSGSPPSTAHCRPPS